MMARPASRAAGLLLILGAFSGAASAETTVLRSSGPSAAQYPPGRTLPDGARLVLRAGDVVTLVQEPFARVFRGPGTFVARMADPVPGGSGIVSPLMPPRQHIGAVRNEDVADPALSRFILCPADHRCPR